SDEKSRCSDQSPLEIGLATGVSDESQTDPTHPRGLAMSDPRPHRCPGQSPDGREDRDGPPDIEVEYEQHYPDAEEDRRRHEKPVDRIRAITLIERGRRCPDRGHALGPPCPASPIRRRRDSHSEIMLGSLTHTPSAR